MPEASESRVCGVVSIIGRPNAGKSTLLNALVGQKLAIVANKPQTTRTSVKGILTMPGAQIVFVDTPGIHKSDTLFNKRMMQEVRAALEDRDLLLYLADATRRMQTEDQHALEMVRKSGTPTLLLLTKIDKVKEKHRLLPLIEQYSSAATFEEILPVSGRTGDGLELLKQSILSRLPQGPPLFGEDQITDQPERFLAAELVREKVLQETHQEVPHSVAVVVDLWEEKASLTKIMMTIYVERGGQKAILIGRGAEMLKKVGTLARADIEAMLGRKVLLELFVKVHEHWRESPQFLQQLDWRGMVGGE